MAKTLNQFLEGYLKVKNPDEQKFVDKHVAVKHADRNGNDDEVFKGSKVKQIDRRKDRHGYNPGEDEKVYEALKGDQHKIDANKNGKVDAHDFKLLRKKKKVAEEVEELEELSNDTLRSYRMKAKSIADHGGKQRTQGRELAGRKSYGGRMAGIEKAKVMAAEEVEQIDELSKKTVAAYAIKAKNQMGRDEYKAGVKMGERGGRGQDAMEKAYNKRADKRHKGLDMALNKLAKEEVEELDELSKDTMLKYLSANKKSDAKAQAAGDHSKSVKRMRGTDLAVRKYTAKPGSKSVRVPAKEEVELEEKLTAKTPMGKYIKDFQKSDAPQFKGKSQDKRRVMAIAAKLTAERGGKPLRKEEKLANLLGDLTESHRRTIFTVFEKLSEDNQKKFLEACQTPEGVEYMLDFAISHRGE